MASVYLTLFTEGVGVTLLLNGFPVYVKFESDSERVSERVVPFLRTGQNTLQVFLKRLLPDQQTGAEFELRLATVETEQPPADGTPILEYKWDASLPKQSVEAGESVKLVFQTEFLIEESLGPWTWERIPPEPITPARETEVYRFYSAIVEVMRTGNPDRIVPPLEMRFREIGAASGVAYDRIKVGFAAGIANLAKAEDFRIDLIDVAQATFLWEQQGRWCSMRREDGSSAIHIVANGISQPFDMIIGKVNGTWAIVR